jgi:hypothetical protein
MSHINEFDTKILDPNWYTTSEHHEVFKLLRDEDPRQARL